MFELCVYFSNVRDKPGNASKSKNRLYLDLFEHVSKIILLTWTHSTNRRDRNEIFYIGVLFKNYFNVILDKNETLSEERNNIIICTF